MIEFSEKLSEDNVDFIQPRFSGTFKPALVTFFEKMGSVFEVQDFLLSLKAQIPKKLKIGECILFYESKQTGLRRAYIKTEKVYEQEAQNKWPVISAIQLSHREHNLYLAHEIGRPFSKTLMVPLTTSEDEAQALLFIELNREGKLLEELMNFFEERNLILNLIFKRVLLNTNFMRISYLWSQFFTHWWEPLAILQSFKAVRLNDAFKELVSLYPYLLEPKKLYGIVEAGEKMYRIHYYPISQFKDLKQAGVLYCQDMTKHFYLKEQLFQSEKMTSLCELGKNMAHQLNNPLTGVRSMAQILCKNPDLDFFKEDLVEMEKSVGRSQKIIESLLSFSQLQQKQEFCDLNQVVEDTLPLLKSMTRDFKIKIDLNKQPVTVKGDSSILQQVVYNLILNACQALKEEGTVEGCIWISTHISKHKACLKVKDNGPGVAPQNKEKIFQALWTSKKKGQGTGLGLGIARRFVRELGGDISVSSQEKKQTCFTVSLFCKTSQNT